MVKLNEEIHRRREAARQAGTISFDPDEPCRRGHRAYRRTSNLQCMQCEAQAKKQYREELKQIRSQYDGGIGGGTGINRDERT